MDKASNRFLAIILVIILLTGCTSFTANKKDVDNSGQETNQSDKLQDSYPYIENQQYNIASVSDENNIFVIFKDKLYSINRENHQYTLLYEGNGFGGIAMYKEWIYCIQTKSNGNIYESTIYKISKDGSERIEILSGAFYQYCWIYDDTLYTMNISNNELIEGYYLSEEGEIIGEISSDNDNFLFKSYSIKQNDYVELEEDKKLDYFYSKRELGPVALGEDGFNRVNYGINLDKEYLNEGANSWIINNAISGEEIMHLEVFDDKGIIMNGEIAYIDDKHTNSLKFIDFGGNETGTVEMSDVVIIGMLNYDKDWVYFYTDHNNKSFDTMICRINRKTYKLEELVEGLSYSIPTTDFNNFFDLFDLDTKEKIYIE